MRPTRRRAIVLFLAALALVVCGRLVDAALGAPATALTPGAAVIRLESPAALLAAPAPLEVRLAVEGLPRSAAEAVWEARLPGRPVAAGTGRLAADRGGAARLRLSFDLPAIDRPAGLDLRVSVRAADAASGAETVIAAADFQFAVYPAAEAAALSGRLRDARFALYDPEGRAAPLLDHLGVPHQAFAGFAGLALYEGDAIIVGPGGFGRGREGLGPILAARARAGMRILLLEQPALPATLSEDLRLWPTWRAGDDATVLVAADHPVLRGVTADGPAGFLDAGGRALRPLLPPTRGNFRVIAGVRVGAGAARREGVRLLELALGEGAVLAVQAPVCSDFRTDARARLLLINALAHLAEGRPQPARVLLYGRSVDDLPPCVARLAPRLDPAADGLAGARLLLVPGDWRAPRLAAAAGVPPLAAVGRYLRSGGTVVLLDPQALVRPYLEAIVGSAVRFEVPPAPHPRAAALPLFDGIATADLALLGGAGRPQIRLRPGAGPGGIEPLAHGAGLAAWRVGRGTLVALTLPDSCAAAPTRSLLARLFTNLGVPLDRPVGPAAAAALREGPPGAAE